MAKSPANGKKPGIGHNSSRTRVARVGPLYKTYRFKDRDPVLGVLQTAMDDAKAKPSSIKRDSGVSVSALYNWRIGKTRKPQFATVVAVARALPGAIEQVGELIRRGR